jgi:hypothetical protein
MTSPSVIRRFFSDSEERASPVFPLSFVNLNSAAMPEDKKRRLRFPALTWQTTAAHTRTPKDKPIASTNVIQNKTKKGQGKKGKN